MPSKNQKFIRRLSIMIVGVAVCLYGIWFSASEAFAQHLAGQAVITESVAEADRAVVFGRGIPEMHYARAIILERKNLQNFVVEYEQAVALRANDYALWLELGRARDRAGDVAGSIAAFEKSANLAPTYAQPRWQLGNALYRAGRTSEAVAQLRLAAESNPKLALPTLTLIWSAVGGDVSRFEQAVAPASSEIELALARFLMKRGNLSAAMRHFRAAGGVKPEEQRELIKDLVATKNFEAAFEVWSTGRGTTVAGEIDNGGFEAPIDLSTAGFGWQLSEKREGVQVSLDPAEHQGGSYSLRVDWNGNADTSLPIVSQLVLVEPNRRYRLEFAARGQDLVMLGLPIVSVSDANELNTQSAESRKNAFGLSETVPKGSSSWKKYIVEFSTGSQTSAVNIQLSRDNCETAPCPAFGHAWFDDFSLTRINQ
jgi:tetratricopeptide (TPR) repeat protein